MAVNAPVKLFSEGASTKVALYRFTGFTAGDTFQMSADFTKVQAAYLIASTANAFTVAPVISANTVLTPASSLALDDGYLLVFGSSV